MGIKQNAEAHFKAKLSQELQSIDVPEWKGKIFYKGAINGKQQSEILKLYAQDKHTEAMYMSLIMRALNEDGSRVWKPLELSEMMRTLDPDVVGRVVPQISDDDDTVEEVKKS
jgi:hypothetical protein